MADAFVTLSSLPLLPFLEALLLRKAAQTTMLTGKLSEFLEEWRHSMMDGCFVADMM